MNNNLLILGAGGHGRVVRETAMAMESFDKIDFLDDSSDLAIEKCDKYQDLTNEYFYAFVAFGINKYRIEWVKKLLEVGFNLPTLIHPTAYLSPSASIGFSSIVCAHSVIHTNAIIEQGSIVSIGALIDHDSHIGEYSHINAGAIVKAGSFVKPFEKVDAGSVYSGEKSKNL